MKACVINLDRSADRLAHMRAEFERIGVAFERVQAVDGSALSAKALEDFRSARTAAKPEGWLAGEIGCFLSHLSVWQQIAAGDDDWAAVFEDDLRVSSDLGRLLASDDWIPPDADIIRLEANRSMRLSGGKAIGVVPVRKIHRALSGTPGSAGYIIARRTAQWLGEIPPALHTSVDVFLFKPKASRVARKLNRYQIVPAVCVQDEVLKRGLSQLESLIKTRNTRGRAYRERSYSILHLWPVRRFAVPFRS